MFRFNFNGLLLFYDLTILIVYYRHVKLPELMFLLIIMMFFFRFHQRLPSAVTLQPV
jgi:hypothetical protein